MYLMVFSVRGMMTCSLEVWSAECVMVKREGRIHCVDPAVNHFDYLVQNHKSCLKARELDERLYCPYICLPRPLHLLSTFSKTRQTEVVRSFFRCEALELRQEDSGNVFLPCPYSEGCRLDRLLNLIAYISAHGVCDFGEGESGNLHDSAHFPLGFIDASSDLLLSG